ASLRTALRVDGGGSLPGEGRESAPVEVDPAPAGAAAVLARLRAGDPPVIARAERGRVVVDLRTVPPDQDGLVAGPLASALMAAGGGGGGSVAPPSPRARWSRRPRQVGAGPRADRDRPGPACGGEGPRHDHRPRLRLDHPAVRARGRLRRRA